jgi:hypothetical protein
MLKIQSLEKPAGKKYLLEKKIHKMLFLQPRNGFLKKKKKKKNLFGTQVPNLKWSTILRFTPFPSFVGNPRAINKQREIHGSGDS